LGSSTGFSSGFGVSSGAGVSVAEGTAASNVDVVREMTEMISAQRAFEMNAKVMQSIDQVLQHTSNIR
jgi:flagellar basal-body rod protein FlgG